MKIAIVLPSRGNPQRLQAILTALDHLASGQHTISYHLIVDEDDEATRAAQASMPSIRDIQFHWGDSAISHFTRLNQVVRMLDADAVSWFTDDVFPLAMFWDVMIASGIEINHLPAFAWMEVTDSENVTFPVLSRRWLVTLDYMFPEYFPYWFVDTWIKEIHELAFGQALSVIQNLPVGGRRGVTRNMRDADFWFRFFEATHPQRAQDAMRVGKEFGVEVTEEQRVAITRSHHETFLLQLESVPEYERLYGVGSETPSARYSNLKTAAEKWLLDCNDIQADASAIRREIAGVVE